MTVRVVALLLLLLASVPLQGCFPVVATGVGAGVMLAQDRRTKDAIFDDPTKIPELSYRLIYRNV